MKILFISQENTANVAQTLVKTINRFTPHDATLVQAHTNWLNYPTGHMENTLTDIDFKRMVFEADVIHFDIISKLGCVGTKVL